MLLVHANKNMFKVINIKDGIILGGITEEGEKNDVFELLAPVLCVFCVMPLWT